MIAARVRVSHAGYPRRIRKMAALAVHAGGLNTPGLSDKRVSDAQRARTFFDMRLP